MGRPVQCRHCLSASCTCSSSPAMLSRSWRPSVSWHHEPCLEVKNVKESPPLVYNPLKEDGVEWLTVHVVSSSYVWPLHPDVAPINCTDDITETTEAADAASSQVFGQKMNGPIVQMMLSTSWMILCADDCDTSNMSDISLKLFWLDMYQRNISTFFVSEPGGRPWLCFLCCSPAASSGDIQTVAWWHGNGMQKCSHPCLAWPPTLFQSSGWLCWLQQNGYQYPISQRKGAFK